MESTITLPVLDTEKLKQKATEYAMQGALESIKEHYTGYNSPFKKAIDAELKKNEIGFGIKLPDIIALLNESMGKEIDTIANAAIAQSYLPQVRKFLTRVEKEIKFSEILQEFVKAVRAEDREDCSVEIEKNTKHGWLDVNITFTKEDEKDKSYRLTLHEDYKTKDKPEREKKYSLLSLPRDRFGDYGHKTMKISIDGGATLEMPFLPNVLQDEFISYLAKLIIADSDITMDCDSFDEDMFPEKCHC